MTEGQLMSEAMVEVVKDVVSAVATLDSAGFGRLRAEERNSEVILRILRSNVENREGHQAYRWMERLLADIEVNVREQSEWARS